MVLNPLLHRLFLDYDIIFLFLDNIEKILALNTCEYIMENGAFAPRANAPFSIIFSNT